MAGEVGDGCLVGAVGLAERAAWRRADTGDLGECGDDDVPGQAHAHASSGWGEAPVSMQSSPVAGTRHLPRSARWGDGEHLAAGNHEVIRMARMPDFGKSGLERNASGFKAKRLGAGSVLGCAA